LRLDAAGGFSDHQPVQTRRISLTAQPDTDIRVDHFRLETIDLPALREGEVLTRTLAFSLDPYLARRMRDWTQGEPDWRKGIIVGRTIGEVINSRAAGPPVGSIVLGFGRWQDFDVRPAAGLTPIARRDLPLTAHLGPLGTSGLTAWAGIEVLDPKPGETLSVSSAAGAVGSIAGQLARLRGARVVGIAGGAAKTAKLLAEYRFDAAVDYRAPDFAAALAAAAPQGITAHFENVGASMLDPVLACLSHGGCIALCGLIQHYQDETPVALANFRLLLTKAVRLRGYQTAAFADRFAEGLAELGEHVRSGEIRYAETRHYGLEAAPAAFVGMLAGKGDGKHLILLDEKPPTADTARM
jgi:NADPH-dependent curcumin reductase